MWQHLVDVMVARRKTSLWMSKTGLVAQNRKEWCALSDAAAIHVLPPMTSAGGGMTDGLTVWWIHCICYQVSYELKTLKHKYIHALFWCLWCWPLSIHGDVCRHRYLKNESWGLGWVFSQIWRNILHTFKLYYPLGSNLLRIMVNRLWLD